MCLPPQENLVSLAPNCRLNYSFLHFTSSSFCNTAPKCVVLGGVVFSYTGLLQSRYAVCVPF